MQPHQPSQWQPGQQNPQYPQQHPQLPPYVAPQHTQGQQYPQQPQPPQYAQPQQYDQSQQYEQSQQYNQPHHYDQTQQAQTHQAQPQQWQPVPPAPRRNTGLVALIASLSVLAVVVVGIVVVLAIRNAADESPTANGPGPASAPAAGPVEPCLVGTWKMVDFQRNIVFTDTDVGRRENLTAFNMSGQGTILTIAADGSADEDDSATKYTGKAADGRTVEAQFSGVTKWKLRTDQGKIFWTAVSGGSSLVVSVNGRRAGEIILEPILEPTTYSCLDNTLRTTAGDNSGGYSRYERTS